MTYLVAGQNSELGSHELTFSVDPPCVTAAALVLDDQRRALPGGYVDPSVTPRHPGVTALDGNVSISLGTVTDKVARVLCLALDPQPGATALTCTLTDGQGRRTDFTVPAADMYPVVIGFELYQRAGRWKVRAIGQGYVGGAADLARAHGIPDGEILSVRQTPAMADPNPAVPLIPLGDQDPLQRISMIHEDAARSTAALLTARRIADQRRDTEMTAAVADPATRNTAAGRHALAEAQRRHDELLAAASADYRRDAAHLIAELNALDEQLPSALASWSALAWRQPARPATGVRLGTVTVPDAGPLAIPLCLPAPFRRPVWIDTREPAAATAALASLLTRLLAAAPPPHRGIDVIDLADALGPLTEHLQAHMPRPPVTGYTDVTARLQQLVRIAELAALHGDPATGGIVVITDPGYGLPAEAIQAAAQLINNSVPASISVLFVGDHSDAVGSAMPLLRDIGEYSHRIRGDAYDLEMLDPWTQTPWCFVPDTLEPGPRLADLINTVASSPDPRAGNT